MNIWALDKDVTIKHLLLLLMEYFSDKDFKIEDSGELPATAVRLRSRDNPTLSAYLFTHGQPEDRYGLHLEYPVFAESNVGDSVEMLEYLELDRLMEFLALHFGILSGNRRRQGPAQD